VKASWLIENVVLDSLTFLELLPAEALEVADVGSGAGIPGVPIAIVRPDLALTLIEGRRRRVSFLSTVIRELGLSRTTVVEARVEDLAGSHRDRFDAIVMRCAGSPEALLPPARTLLRSGGAIIMSARRGREVDGAETIAIRTKAGHARLLHRFLKP